MVAAPLRLRSSPHRERSVAPTGLGFWQAEAAGRKPAQEAQPTQHAGRVIQRTDKYRKKS